MNRDSCVRYIDKSRNFYAAHGYAEPYHWAQHESIPFTAPRKPLAECKLSLVTTAMADAAYVGKNRRLTIGDLSNPPADFFTGDLSWDKEATHTRDRESYFPIRELQRAVGEGRLAGLSEHYYCVPTSYSIRATVERDAPTIVKSCLEDGVDIALLVPL
jgi:D-proline reductase (dithiol) PrdB